MVSSWKARHVSELTGLHLVEQGKVGVGTDGDYYGARCNAVPERRKRISEGVGRGEDRLRPVGRLFWESNRTVVQAVAYQGSGSAPAGYQLNKAAPHRNGSCRGGG